MTSAHELGYRDLFVQPPTAAAAPSLHTGPRDQILDRASSGEITPDEAEAEAARLGLRPFAHKPEPAEFNPMS